MHNKNCFLTLTYSPENMPVGSSLVYRDFQLFMKRLRKSVGFVRFFMAGEYGSEHARPHYHSLIFGFDFPDRVYWGKSPGGAAIFRSALLESLWPYGFSSVGELTFQSAAYVARYSLKKVNGRDAQGHYEFVDSDGVVHDRVPEFARMSLKPGIGGLWLDRFLPDILDGSVVVDGRKVSLPRYFAQRVKGFDPLRWDALSFDRQAAVNLDDQTPDRLSVREQVANARVKILKRSLE